MAKRLPPIYVDEHLAPEVARAFREEGFRVIETQRSRGFAGRDEMDYLAGLRRDRGIFVTSDQQQVDRIRAGRHKHPGVVFLNREWDREAKVALAGVMAETIKAAIAVLGSTGFYDIVLEPGLGGLYYDERVPGRSASSCHGRDTSIPPLAEPPSCCSPLLLSFRLDARWNATWRRPSAF